MKHKLNIEFEVYYDSSHLHNIKVFKNIEIDGCIGKDHQIDGYDILNLNYNTKEKITYVDLCPFSQAKYECIENLPEENDQSMQHIIDLLDKENGFHLEHECEKKWTKCLNFWKESSNEKHLH
jgi:hypothetical protein